MKTILKWPGGKEKELPIIRRYMPEYTGRYVEPFVGGGAVFFDQNNLNCYINDRSDELINLYSCVKDRDQEFIHYLNLEDREFNAISDFIDNNRDVILRLYNGALPVDGFLGQYGFFFDDIAIDYHNVFFHELTKNLNSKISRSHRLENTHGFLSDSDRIDNIESALKSAYYMYIRYLLNHQQEFDPGRRAAVFFFVREYCYSSMFRYNTAGEFNVPYGGISYNRKDLGRKIAYMLSQEMTQKLQTADLSNLDFEDFIERLHLNRNDFMFLDPPYDSDFSTYAQNGFGQAEQIRLRNCLLETNALFMLIIKNTDFIYNLYNRYFHIGAFDKKYMVSFMNRNERDVEHLVITNY